MRVARTPAAFQRGATLAIGLMLLTLVTLLGLAGANAARVELMLAQNEQFRENAAAAASAGIEFAISRIATMPTDAIEQTSSVLESGTLDTASQDRWETRRRFTGFETGLPQLPGPLLAGAHFEIISTGHSARRSVDVQRQGVMRIVPAPPGLVALAGDALGLASCVPESAHCWSTGQMRRVYWQRVAGAE